MSRTIAFIERKYWKKGGVAYSIERVFLEVSAALRDTSCAFFKLPFGNRLTGILCNLLFFRRPDADIYHLGEEHSGLCFANVAFHGFEDR